MRKLYYSNGSPFARRVRIVLLEKSLEFASDVNDMVRPIEEIEPINPALQVPVLDDGERRLFGSNLILRYLFETYAETPAARPPLAPSFVRTDRHWDDEQTLVAIDAMADALVSRALHAGADEAAVPYLARQRHRVVACLDWLERRIEPEGFWPGTFSVPDIGLMCPLLWAEKRGIHDFRTGQWPRIAAMVDRWATRPSVAATPVNDLPRR